MKFGKFQQKAKEAQTRLRKGEVKRYVNGKLVSNKD
jgi:D-ribose pyranose/furanose isomerase RbsD